VSLSGAGTETIDSLAIGSSGRLDLNDTSRLNVTDDHGFSGNDSQVFGQLRAQQFSVIDISNADHLFAAFGPLTVTDNAVVIN
jgi:hypothetical protein